MARRLTIARRFRLWVGQTNGIAELMLRGHGAASKGVRSRAMFYVVKAQAQHAGKQRSQRTSHWERLSPRLKKGFRPIMDLYENGLPRHSFSLVKDLALDTFGERREGWMGLQDQIEPGEYTIRTHDVFRCSFLITHCSCPLQLFSTVDIADQPDPSFLCIFLHAKSLPSLKLLSYKGFLSTSLTQSLHGLS